MRRLRSALIAVPALAVSCSMCQPPPDPDGVKTGSQPLQLGEWKRDSLDCEDGDCADWYHFETQKEGTLQVDLARAAAHEADDEDEEGVPAFSLVLSDAEGGVLEEVQSDGRPRVAIINPNQKGRYLAAQRFAVAVATPAEGEGELDYEVRVVFTPRPAPKPRAAPPKPAAPRFRTVKGALLEVEGRADGGEAVLIDQGSRAGIERGQRGRLLVGGRKVAEIEIVDVYPDGSRALVRGSAGSALTPDTVAEVDIPL
jgi:hypothetical protein